MGISPDPYPRTTPSFLPLLSSPGLAAVSPGADKQLTDLMADVRREEDSPNHSSDEDQEEFYDAADEVSCNCEEDPAGEHANTAFLDSVFGALPPGNLLKYDLIFSKPPPPIKQHSSVRVLPHPRNKAVSPDAASQTRAEAQMEAAEKMGSMQLADRKENFVRIGGMLALPVPASGPLFSPEEA